MFEQRTQRTADDNMRLLFLQMTAGESCGTINVQVFENGLGSASLCFTFEFCGIQRSFYRFWRLHRRNGRLRCGNPEDDDSCTYAETYYD